jgi:hypothetical protein
MRRLSLMLCVLCVGAPALAQRNRDLFPTFTLTGGGYLGDFGTKVRVDPHVEGLQGTTIDLEKNLGLESSRTLSRFGFTWRPLRKHELGVSYFRTEREGHRIIDRQIVYEDTTFPIQADVQSKFNIDFWEASYTYWARQTERDGIGVSLGVTGLRVDGELSVRRNTDNTVLLSESASTDVPVPVIGVEGRWLLTDRVIAMGRASVLPKVSIKDYQGSAYVGKFSLEYRLAQRLGLGVAYNYFNLNGLVEKEDFHADLGMTVSGVEAFVRIVF